MTWGPFRPDIPEIERRARLRSLRAIVRLTCGPRGTEAANRLRQAESGAAGDLAEAQGAIDRLASLDRRRVLCTFLEVMQ